MRKKLMIWGLILCMVMQNMPLTVLASEPQMELTVTEVSADAETEAELPSQETESVEIETESNPAPETNTESAAETEAETATSVETEGSLETDSSAETDVSLETDVSEETDVSLETDISEETDVSPETDVSEEAEESPETETAAETETQAELSAQEAETLQCVPISETGIIQTGSLEQVSSILGEDFLTSSSTSYTFAEVEAYVVEQMLARAEQITVSQFVIPPADFQSLFSGIVNEHPELYFLDVGNTLYYSYSTKVAYIEPAYSTAYDDEAFYTAVDDALSQVDASMSDAEKALVIHDYLTINCEYDYDDYLAGTLSDESYTAYGTLVNHESVCQGYALAFKYLLEQMGIPCHMVTSTAMSHAWNLVEIGGNYYHTDVTWDDPVDDDLGYSRHNYFLVSETQMAAYEADAASTHHDWTIQKDGAALEVSATSTTYDSAFWSLVESPVLFADDAWFYILDSSIIRRDHDTNATSTLYTFSDIWYVWNSSSSYWPGAHSGLALLGGKLYFNTPYKIYSLSTDGQTVAAAYTPDTSSGYIYGIASQSGSLKYTLKQSPNDADQIYTATLSETAGVLATRLEISADSLTVQIGETAELTLKILPSYATDQSIVWTSSNETVATVSGGIVSAVSDGSCTITASNQASGLSVSCSVTVPVPKYQVTFLDKSDVPIETVTVTRGQSASAPSAPEVAGYEFSEWDQDLTNITGNLTVRPIYTPIQYQISYETYGADENDNPTSYTIESDTITLNAPVRQGYLFLGWYTNELLQDKVTEIPSGSTGDQIFYASWMEIVSAPTADIESGSAIDKDSQITLSCTTKDAVIYYTLDGTDPTADSFCYEEPVTITEDCTLKAFAVKENCADSPIVSYTYDVYENLLILDATEASLVQDHTLTLTVLQLPETKTAEDITWTSTDETIAAVSDTGEVTALLPGTATIQASVHDYKGREVTASCEVTVAIRYFTVTFYDHSGNEIDTQQVAKNNAAQAPQLPEVNGYAFKSWNPSSFENVTEDLEIHAEYEPISYTITYHLNGGTAAEEPVTAYTIESETITLPVMTHETLYFVGWFSDEDMTSVITEIPAGSYGNLDVYACFSSVCGKGLEAVWQDDVTNDTFTYTGKAIKPAVTVYDNGKELTLNKDYTISYKNNTKVNRLETEAELAKAPSVVIKGKGNYRGTISKTFRIVPYSLNESGISIDSPMAVYNKKVIKPVPTILRDGKKLTNKKDFIVEYPTDTAGGCKDPGVYTLRITGINGYCDSVEIPFTIIPTQERLLSKVSVKASSAAYTGEQLLPELIVKYGKEQLTAGVDYFITPVTDCTQIGTHTILLTGAEDSIYQGQKKVTFKITGANIKNTTVSAVASLTYTGEQQLPKITVTPKATSLNPAPAPLTEGVDYEVSCAEGSNIKAGTVTLIITGKGHYSGSTKKTFRITAYDITAVSSGADPIQVNMANGSSEQIYEKGGSKPKVTVTFHGQPLTEGTDYTLSYKNNTKVNDGSNPQQCPTVTIKGKGNFKGTRTLTFTIAAADLSSFGQLYGQYPNITAADVVTKNKKNTYQSKPVLTDANGKKLTAGTDYEKTLIYRNADGQVLGKEDFPKPGDIITVTVTGKGNYTGSVSASYTILPKNMSIASASVKLLSKQYYTGERIYLTCDDLQVRIGKNTYLDADDFRIIAYTNNLKKGTATVTIEGIGEYGGTKTIKFLILPQILKWFLPE